MGADHARFGAVPLQLVRVVAGEVAVLSDDALSVHLFGVVVADANGLLGEVHRGVVEATEGVQIGALLVVEAPVVKVDCGRLD